MKLSDENIGVVEDIINMYSTMKYMRNDHTHQEDFEDIRSHLIDIRNELRSKKIDNSVLAEISEMNWTRWNTNIVVDYWKILNAFQEI